VKSPAEQPVELASTRAVSTSALAVALVVLGIVFFGLCEVAARLSCNYLATKSVFYAEEPGDFAAYLRVHDPQLGWPALTDASGQDGTGARPSPAFPDRGTGVAAISTYGDSFTWSAGAGDEEAWPEVLGNFFGVRVDNFGVGGYGSDQAFLRYRQKAASGVDKAPIVILAHLSENVIRNLNQFRDLIYSAGGLGFKPRFVLNGAGGLEEIPLRLPNVSDYERFVRDPNPFLDHEAFAIGSPDGPWVAHFPYLVSAVTSLGHPRVRSFFAGEPFYARFYDLAHPGNGTRLTASIMETFWREAAASGRTGVVMIIPTGLDIAYFRAHQKWPYAPLVQELQRRAVPFLDLGPFMEERTRGEQLETFFLASEGTSGHFNARGYRLLAEGVKAYLDSLKVTPARSSPN